VLLLPLYRIRKSFYFTHRGGSHTLFTAIGISALFAGIFWAVTGESFFVAWLVGALFYCLHLCLDTLTTYRVPWFYPLSKNTYKLDFEVAVNPVLMFASLGVNLFLVYYQMTPGVFQTVVTGIAICYYVYLAHRVALKLIVERKVPPGTHYSPGILPLVYFLFTRSSTETGTEYRLTENYSGFRKPKELLASNLAANSPDVQWVELAKGALPSGRWIRSSDNFIPRVENRGDRVLVKLVYAQTFMASRAICFTVEFDQETQQVVEVHQQFDRIKLLQQEYSQSS